jgi:hypothetical protein
MLTEVRDSYGSKASDFASALQTVSGGEIRPAFLDEVIVRHGGLDRWRALDRIEAELSSGGLAFASRGQARALIERHVTVHPHARRVVLEPFPRQGICGEWTPDRVRIMDEDGQTVAERRHPRQAFASLLRQFRWDDLDMLYFAGYALWNYLSFPFLLADPGVDVQEQIPSSPRHDSWRRLNAIFADGYPTHSARQSFLFDEHGLLRHHDYVADVIGRWASAANVPLASEEVGGLRFYTRRRVYPRIKQGLVLPFPTLVWIEFGALSVHVVPAAR